MVERADGGRRAVLHFVERWLPRSESFVYDLVTRTSHPAVVVSSCRTENRQLFPFAPLHSLLPVREPFRRYYVTPRLMALARRHSVGLVHVHHGYRVYEVIGA